MCVCVADLLSSAPAETLIEIFKQQASCLPEGNITPRVDQVDKAVMDTRDIMSTVQPLVDDVKLQKQLDDEMAFAKAQCRVCRDKVMRASQRNSPDKVQKRPRSHTSATATAAPDTSSDDGAPSKDNRVGRMRSNTGTGLSASSSGYVCHCHNRSDPAPTLVHPLMVRSFSNELETMEQLSGVLHSVVSSSHIVTETNCNIYHT